MPTHLAAPRPTDRIRVTFAFAAATLVALLAALLTPMAAHAAVSLSGVVVGPTGAPLSGIAVKAVDPATGNVIGSATSSSSGAFSFTLTSADYTLQFPATATTFPQYLGGTSVLANAQRITLTDKSFLKAALSAAGTLKGSVQTASKTAVSGATVTVYAAKDQKWISVKSVKTTSSGAYSVMGLEPGSYRVGVTKGTTYAPVFSGGAASIQAATDLGLLASKTTTANFTVGKPSKVSGTVRFDDGSTVVPLAGVTVSVYRFVGSASPSAAVEKLAATATTSATGAYSLTGLPPGDYTLHFAAPASSDAGSAFLGGASRANEALSFVVGSGASVTGRNITLLGAATISGTYTRVGGGAPVINARVSLYGETEDPDDPLVVPQSVVFTDVTGAFQFANLGPGDYQLVFGAFERSTPSENIDFERRGWSTINLAAGEDHTGVNQTTENRDPYAPLTGQEPDIIYGSYLMGLVGGYAELSIGTWNNSGYNVVGGYRWYRDGVLIPGEGNYRYYFRAGDLGHKISGEVYRTDWAIGYGSYRTGETAAVLPGPAPTFTSVPAIIGPATVGRVLTVDPKQWEVIDDSHDSAGRDIGVVWTYTWQRSVNNSTWTTLETAPTHTITAADLISGPYIRVHMHGERYGYDDVDYDTLSVFVQQGQFVQLTAPKVTKTTTKFTATPGTWSPVPEQITYAWQIWDAANNIEQTVTTQTLSRTGLTGKKVTLAITYKSAQVEDEVVNLPVQTGKAPTVISGTNTVNGTVRIGNSITGPNWNWSLGPDSITYKWQYLSGKTWKTISGATTWVYSPTPAYVGKRLRVIGTAITAGYANGTKTSDASVPVAIGLAVGPNDAPSFTATPAVNATAVVDPKTTTPTADSVSYSWKSGPSASGPWTTISGVTTASYKVPLSLLDKYLQVTVTHKLAGHQNLVQTVTDQVVKGVPVNTVKPTVHSTAPGVFEVSSNGTWTPAPTSFEYNWKAIAADGSGDVDYGGGSSFNSNPVAGFQPVDLVVTSHGPVNWGDGSVRIPVKNGAFQYNDPAKIQNSGASVGTQLNGTLSALYNGPVGASQSPQWEYEKTPNVWVAIPGATSIDYTPTATYLGKNVRLKVRTTADRYAPSDSVSDPLAVQLGQTPQPGSGPDYPTFSDFPRVGEKLTFSPGVWDVAGLAFTYQWQSRENSGDPWANIPGATSTSYTPDVLRWGHELQMKVTAKKAGYPDAFFELNDGAIGDGFLIPVVLPTVTKSGSTLTAHAGTWNAAGATFVYQWVRSLPDGSDQILLTGQSYTLTPADAGFTIYVGVYASAPHYANGSANVVGQAGPKIEPTSTVTISGERVAGQVLTASTPAWNISAAVTGRQWLRNGVAIPGETALSYQTTPSDVGKTIACA